MLDKLLKKLGFTKKTLLYFLIIASSSQIIYSIYAIKGVAYEPFRELLGLTNSQLGLLFTLPGIMQTIFCAPLGFLQDRVSSRKLLALNLVLSGLSGFLLVKSPGFIVLAAVYALLGITQDSVFWSAVLKSVRTMADDEKQGTAFGIFELLRGGWEFLTNGIVLILFAMLGQSLLGVRLAIIINSSLMIACAMLVWFVLPEENFLKSETKGARNKEAFQGLKKAITMPEVWLVGLAASSVYTIYIGIQYFLPFMQNVFGLPVVLAGIFGLFNTSGTRIMVSPLAGLIGDNKFKSSSHFMNKLFIVITMVLAVLIFIPKNSSLTIPVMIVLVLVTIACYMLRGVYYAPIGELKIPRSISGSAMSVASFVGYSPCMWAFYVYGSVLDNFPKEKAYMIIFAIQIGFALAGILFTYILSKKIEKRKLEEANETSCAS